MSRPSHLRVWIIWRVSCGTVASIAGAAGAAARATSACLTWSIESSAAGVVERLDPLFRGDPIKYEFRVNEDSGTQASRLSRLSISISCLPRHASFALVSLLMADLTTSRAAGHNTQLRNVPQDSHGRQE